MITLYGYPGSASLAAHILLEEAGAEYTFVRPTREGPDAGPVPGDPERGVWYRWLVYLSNTARPALYQYIYPERYVVDAEHVAGAKQVADAALGGIWDWIDTDLADRAFLVGDRFSAADAYLWMLGRWSRHQANPAFARPNIRRFWDQMLERPSLLRVIEQEELAWVP